MDILKSSTCCFGSAMLVIRLNSDHCYPKRLRRIDMFRMVPIIHCLLDSSNLASESVSWCPGLNNKQGSECVGFTLIY